MTLQEAKNLVIGQTIYHATKKNADGTKMRAKVTRIKTWKKDPNRLEVHVKRGLYEFVTFYPEDLDNLTTKED